MHSIVFLEFKYTLVSTDTNISQFVQVIKAAGSTFKGFDTIS
jgi:hypothetical protein